MAGIPFKAANVTKYDAGGSGDNYIPDGYIKSVEKIWMDSYSVVSGGLGLSNATITIARLPSNKKITSIDIAIDTALSHTSSTIAIGHAGDDTAFLGTTTITHNLTQTCISLPVDGIVRNLNASNSNIKLSGFQLVTNGTTGDITITILANTSSAGTIKSVVRYT